MRESSGALESASIAFLSAIEPNTGLDAILFLRRTGSVLASWCADGVPTEIVSVMSATMLASIDTIVEALGGPTSKSISVSAGDHQLVASKIGSQAFLCVIGPSSMSQRTLQNTIRRISARLNAPSSVRLRVKTETRSEEFEMNK